MDSKSETAAMQTTTTTTKAMTMMTMRKMSLNRRRNLTMTMTMMSDTFMTRSEVGLVLSKTKDGHLYRASLSLVEVHV
jgi:hypothetical protein